MTIDPTKLPADCEVWTSGDVTLIRGDCLAVLPAVSGVDAVVTDPPYGVGLKYKNYKDKRKDHASFVLSFFPTIRQISPVVVLTPGYRSMWLYPEPDHVICRYDRTAQSPHTLAYMNKWEPVFVWGRPKAKRPAWDVIETRCQVERRRIPVDHPCPKTLDLMVPLVEMSCAEGGTILDPFTGSGTTGVACVNLGRKFIGIEISPEYFAIAKARITKAQQAKAEMLVA